MGSYCPDVRITAKSAGSDIGMNNDNNNNSKCPFIISYELRSLQFKPQLDMG